MPLPKTQPYTFGMLTNFAQKVVRHLVAIRQRGPREAFSNTFDSEVFEAILLRWMTICNTPFSAVENTSFRLLAGCLAARARSCCSPRPHVYTRPNIAEYERTISPVTLPPLIR